MMNYYNQPQAQMYQQVPQPNYTQPLSAEEIAMLMKGTKSSWTMALTPEEKLRAICTHKDPTKGNQFSLVPVNNGFANAHKCYICNEEVILRDYTKDDAIAATEEVINILQNVKTTFLDIAPGVAQDYFILIPLLRKLPELLEIAKNNFAKYDSALHNPMYGTGNTFAALNTLLTPGGFGMNPGMMGMNPGMMGMNPGMQMNMNPAMMNNMQMNNQMPNMNPAQMQMMMNMMAQQQGGQTNLFYDNGQTPPQTPPVQQQQATGKPAQPYTPAPTESSATVSKMFG